MDNLDHSIKRNSVYIAVKWGKKQSILLVIKS